MLESFYSKWRVIVDELIEKKSPYLPSPPDPRDFNLYQIGVDMEAAVPTKIFLPKPPFILDQLNFPICVGAALAGIYNSYYHKIGKLPDSNGFSMAYGYFRCKELDGIPDTPGTYPRVICKVAQQEGIVPERVLPLQPGMKKPVLTEEMKKIAANYKIKSYARVDEFGKPENTIRNIKQALNNGKYILIGSIVTSDNWLSDDTVNTGYLKMPKGSILGGHATFLYGADDTHVYGSYTGYKEGVNSWGDSWGKDGRYFMPYDYVKWETKDLPGFVAFQEAWAIEFENSPNLLKKEVTMKLKIGSNEAIINGEKMKIDDNPLVTPIIYPKWDRTLVPLRFIAERFGAKVTWTKETREIDIELDESALLRLLE